MVWYIARLKQALCVAWYFSDPKEEIGSKQFLFRENMETPICKYIVYNTTEIHNCNLNLLTTLIRFLLYLLPTKSMYTPLLLPCNTFGALYMRYYLATQCMRSLELLSHHTSTCACGHWTGQQGQLARPRLISDLRDLACTNSFLSRGPIWCRLPSLGTHNYFNVSSGSSHVV